MSTGCVRFNSCFSSLSPTFLLFQSYRCSQISRTEAPAAESNRKQACVLAQGRILCLFHTHAKLQKSNRLLIEAGRTLNVCTCCLSVTSI